MSPLSMAKKHIISFLDNVLGVVDDTVGGIIFRIFCRRS